jgi:RNA polymerase sigma-70 factor (ECF subfamily)
MTVDEAQPDPARDAVEAAARQAWERGNHETVAEIVLNGYGSELYSFVLGQCRADATQADDVFSQFTEDFWRGLPRFEWRCSIRAWSYKLARHACSRHWRAGYQRRERCAPVTLESLVDQIEQRARSTTQAHLRTEVKDKVRELRDQLNPADRDLLTLRVDRGLSWRDTAFALRSVDEMPASDEELRRFEVALRQRFVELKRQIKELARAAGLL